MRSLILPLHFGSGNRRHIVKEMTLRTGPRQRLAMKCSGRDIVLESQGLMHDMRSHGWSIVAQHFLTLDQARELREFLADMDEPHICVMKVG